MFGFDDLIAAGLKILDKVIPDPQAKADAQLKLLQLRQAGEFKELEVQLAMVQSQTDTNKEEAKSSSMFVAGARPFILWGCGFAMLYASLFEPILRFIAVVLFNYTGSFPVVDTVVTTQILIGLLGLGGLRSFEKSRGVAS